MSSWADRVKGGKGRSVAPAEAVAPTHPSKIERTSSWPAIPSAARDLSGTAPSEISRTRKACPSATPRRPAARNASSQDAALGTDWLTVEVTLRPDREMEAPDGCEWLERTLSTVNLRWDEQRLKRHLEDLVRRRLAEKASSPAGVERAQKARVWGIRAVGVVMPDGRRHVQLHDRECPWKVDMPWREFVKELPAEFKQPDRQRNSKKFAFGLYLAYDWGVSIHRNLKGKPRAIL